MCKAIRRIVCLVFLFVVVFFVIAVLRGGEPLRWFGKKTEETGKVIRKKSEELADEADRINRTSRELKRDVNEVKKRSQELIKKVK
ncbi:MAG: hypothetical protein D6726_06540 [Nitrospirae bacterium]|nr:MAG: hypothetical protein D6726_06540 [Nitrospirota bacterium]